MTTELPAGPMDLPVMPVTQDDVQWLSSDDSVTYMVRGHVDQAAMLEAVRQYGELEIESFPQPTHAWWRTYPRVVDDDQVQWFQQAEPHARGSFRCTVMTKDW